ncbi:MaoC family dehydratase [Aggregatilinea lenta]|uniref:MaoC family dehydratase n=1 Tax=Aggregatilinea lenta TaxID=913108 RepID=UPI000E5AD5A0|nr:MaoC family dehydratase [Aggregatilinea lenta]
MSVQVGAKASCTKTFSDDDVRQFAHITGDENPVHLDENFAANSRFGRRIVHGILTVGLISKLLGNDLPGPGTLYMGQTLKFKAPVFIGDTVTATVEVIKIRADRGIVTLDTTCVNQDGTVVLEGEAVVMLPPDDESGGESVS